MVFVIVVTLMVLSGCAATGAAVLRPSPCPQWTESAIIDLEMLLELQDAGEIDIVDLEYQLATNLRHCEALDAFLKD